jgi:hypothetical protein
MRRTVLVGSLGPGSMVRCALHPSRPVGHTADNGSRRATVAVRSGGRGTGTGDHGQARTGRSSPLPDAPRGRTSAEGRRALAASRRRHPAGKGRGGVTPPPYVAGMDEHLRAALVPPTGAQQALPFDDEADHPIPFALTARARRTVAPDQLPPLEVVPDRRGDGQRPPAVDEDDDGHLEDPTDTRPARARALRRAGVPVARIASQLRVDDLAVRAWTGDTTVGTDDGDRRTDPAAGGTHASDADSSLALDDERTAFELARAAAREDALDRLTSDAGFAAGVGLVAALAEVDAHAVTLASPHPEVIGRLLAWLATNADVEVARVRVVLRIGPDVAGDLARHRWAARTGVPVDRISHTRWRGAPAPDATDALVRFHDPALAASVAGWRDALLAPPSDHDPADVAF